MTPDETTLLGEPMDDVPERQPDSDCNARKSSSGSFEGYCNARAGAGTDHLGEGRCQWHGGGTPRGSDSPHFKHGLFSDHLGERDRRTIEILDEFENEEKLEELINWRLARLRRALRELNEEEEMSFWNAFKSIINRTGHIEPDDIRELAKLLDKNNRAMQNEIDLVRKLIKDHDRVSGDGAGGGEWVAMLRGGDE